MSIMKRYAYGGNAGEQRSHACKSSKPPESRRGSREAIEVLLTDEQRPGAPGTFTFEQFMQIMALACEKPITLDVPVSAWTPRELADEAVKRGIVKTISPRTVERFLKGERFAAPSQAILADPASRQSRRIGPTDSHGV